MWKKDNAISLTRLEEVPNEKGVALPNEIKGDYLNGTWEDDKEIIVECVNEKKIEMMVDMKETFGELNERVAKESEVMSELSFLYIGEKEVNGERTMDEMDVSDGCVIVQKMSPLANLLKPDTLTPSVVSSLVEYVENVEISKVERILTKSFFEKIEEVMKIKKETYYPIVTILTSIEYRHSLSDDREWRLYDPMQKAGIVKILKDHCERVLKSKISEDEEEMKEKDTIILAYSLVMRKQDIESSFHKRIAEYLIKMILKCVVDSSLFNVGMKAAVAVDGLYCCLFLSLSFSYSIFSSSFYS
jgi:hypothetical protein